MRTALVALLVGAAAALVLRPRSRSPAVLVRAGPRVAGRPAARPAGRTASPLAACAVAAVAAVALLGLAVGGAVALTLVVAGPRLLSRLEPASVRRDRERLVADLPLVLDLLAACLAGGAALPAAAAAVGEAVGGPAGRRLLRVAAALHVGTPPATAWLLLGGDDPTPRGQPDPLAPAARALARAADSGAAVGVALTRHGEDARAQTRAAGAEAARRAGVLAVAPLGLCFLPAFVLLGVVPVVVGLATPVLGLG